MNARRTIGALRQPLERASLLVVATTVFTSGLGFVYWLFAARLYPPAAVGIGAACAAALTVAALLAGAGSGAVLLAHLPQARDAASRQALIDQQTRFSLIAGGVGGAALWIALPFLSSTFRPLAHNVGWAVALTLAASAWTAAMTLDQASVALRQAKIQLLRNLAFSALKLALLGVLAVTAQRDALMIFVGWGASTWLSLLYSHRRLRQAPSRRTRARRLPIPGQFKWQHAISVCSAAPAALLPVVVAARAGSVEAARFYCAWMLAAGVFMTSPAVAQALYAELARDPAQRSAQVRRSLRLILCLAGVAALGVIALGPTLLGVLGRSYAVGAIGLLIVLTASAVPDAITNVAVTVKRADGRFRQAATINAAIAIICLVGAWLAVPSEGAIGAAGAWVVAQIAGALVVAVMALRLPRRSVAAA